MPGARKALTGVPATGTRMTQAPALACVVQVMLLGIKGFFLQLHGSVIGGPR